MQMNEPGVNERKPKKKIIYYSLLLVLIGLNIFASLQTISYGNNLSALEKKQTDLEKENKELVSEIVSATSLLKLSEKSESLGYTNPGKIIYLSSQNQIASLHK